VNYPVVVDVEGLVGVVVVVDFVGVLVVAVVMAFELVAASDVVASVDQNLMVLYSLNHFQKMEFVHKFQVFVLAVVDLVVAELPLLPIQLLIVEKYTVEQGMELVWIDLRVVQGNLVVLVLQLKG
jgi:hypothetical protein